MAGVSFRGSGGGGGEDARFCLLSGGGRGGGGGPLGGAAGRPPPVVRPVRFVAVVDLLHVRRVFDDDAEGIDEVVEEVVARAVAAGPPLDREAGVAHAAAAAHHRLEVRHEEGDVVQRVVVG